MGLPWLTTLGTAAALAARTGRMPSLADRRSISEAECRTCLETGQIGAKYDQGLDTYRVPMALHALNRARLCERLQGQSGVVLVQGGDQQTRYDTDHEPVFRQESYFQWLFGVSEPGCYGAIDLKDGSATLFVPDLRSEAYEIFCGVAPTCEAFTERYAVDACYFTGSLRDWLADGIATDDEAKVYLLHGVNSDSGNYASPATFDGDGVFSERRDLTTLFRAIADLRSRKTKAEVEVMRHVNWVSSMAHSEVMRYARPGQMEYQLESLFMHHTYTHGGCRHLAYTCICACGPNPAVLHYGHAGAPNARLLREGDQALLDMGAEYHCYAADITCSFPIGADFTADQVLVHEAVLAAQLAVIDALRPGVAWPAMHRLAERTILEHLKGGGLLQGNIDEMLDADLGSTFMPHGLGHLIGLDTHDVGGYLEGKPDRPDRPGLNKLRTARLVEEGMMLTVEPGCYFIDRLLDDALHDDRRRFLNVERLEQFRGTGGVRLEDDVLIHADRVENLSLCPRTVEEIRSVKNGESWPPAQDACPGLRRAWCEPNPTVPGGPMKRLRLPVA